MPENKRIRVTDKDTGYKRTIFESELPHGNFTVLKADPVDPVTGYVVPPEYQSETTPSGQSAASTKGKS